MTQTESISPKEWDAVRDLIEEVEQDQKRERLGRSLVEWHLAVRQFRKVEMRRLVLGSPEELDLRCHAICLHSLLAMGEALVVWSRDFTQDHLALLNLSHGDIEACVEELKQSLREWHHGFTDAEMARAHERLFGGAA